MHEPKGGCLFRLLTFDFWRGPAFHKSTSNPWRWRGGGGDGFSGFARLAIATAGACISGPGPKIHGCPGDLTMEIDLAAPPYKVRT